ncbi:MAG: DUF3180 family protein [Pseudoclavibacter sp.]|nr:DUF3180 family protein [Pseudoclavibacter sp.]
MTRRTSPLSLLLLACACGALGWAVESWLVSSGRTVLVAPMTLPITLCLTALVLLVLAWPVRRYTRTLSAAHRHLQRRRDRGREDEEDERGEELARLAAARRVPPQRAVLVLAFAKASSMTGALIGGASAGTAAFLLTRTVVTGAALPEAAAAAIAAALLLAAGLAAESWCTLPPRDGGAVRGQASPAA